jgi:hypothetical protein
MKNKVLFIVLLSFAIPGMVQAQSGYASIQYVIGFGTGDLGSFISKASFRGAVFEYQRNINPNLSAGLEIGWNTFYEKKDYDTYTQETVSVSGLQYRYSRNLGIGTMYTKRDTDMGQWRLAQEAWHFALKPELGLLYELNFSTDLKASAKYYTGFAGGDLESSQSYFAITAGIAFKL